MALNDYVPYLFALDAGFSGKAVGGEEVDVLLQEEIEVEWRSCVAVGQIPGRDPSRNKGKGLDYEILMVLTTLACVHVLQARNSLRGLYDTILPTPEQRTQIITSSSKSLSTAQSIHTLLQTRAINTSDEVATPNTPSKTTPSLPPETDASIQAALAALAHAEATLLAVLKDDPYPAQIVQERNKLDREWMIKAPSLPKVRAHLFARLCLGAAEQAGKAEALFRGNVAGKGKRAIDDELVKYCGNLRRAAKAKACRFFGIDADLGGETGKAIAWLNGASTELGLNLADDDNDNDGGGGNSRGVLRKFKRDFTARREDKKILSSKGSDDWGRDAGILEESRVVAMLKGKWTKMNDKMNTQVIPQWAPLLANNMPSGREMNAGGGKGWEPGVLDEDALARMRVPMPTGGGGREGFGDEDSSDDDDDDDNEGLGVERPPGSFPGGGGAGGGKGNDYY